MTRVRVLPGLSANGYARHALHDVDALWVEKNCYVDVLIELLHTLGLEPLALLGSTASVDFDGDGFTFYKPDHEDLRAFYGVDIQELNVWRPLLDHAVHHLGDGKFLITEANAFWLPDTSGTDYRRHHVKTTIVIADVDVDARRLGYFHNAGYFELDGEDFDRTFRAMPPTPDAVALPLFAEVVRVDRRRTSGPQELAAMARERLRVHVARRPRTNPVARFQAHFEAYLPTMQERGLPHYHAWAFATTRQLGASMELLARHLEWLARITPSVPLDEAAAQFLQLSATAKAFVLKAARAVNGKRPFDDTGTFGAMSDAWSRSMTQLAAEIGS
ncbi:MAG: DUF1839 family protein [Gemmatimonas sp.]|nr:DUF1839 family protein [Gemmatimonas sp.]